eukprot:m.38777 g.38777  ORF g.38777 m.38777 type:complete len:132 (-) comp10241_c0_seq1:393-788(-)
MCSEETRKLKYSYTQHEMIQQAIGEKLYGELKENIRNVPGSDEYAYCNPINARSNDATYETLNMENTKASPQLYATLGVTFPSSSSTDTPSYAELNIDEGLYNIGSAVLISNNGKYLVVLFVVSLYSIFQQ